MRYFLGGLVQRVAGGSFPWGTFAVNMAGCFLFGLVWALIEERSLLAPSVRFVALVGFMGAFTTFSTFMFETGALVRESQWMLAFANIALQNVVGMVFLFLGLFAGRAV
jgi:CrcB protein